MCKNGQFQRIEDHQGNCLVYPMPTSIFTHVFKPTNNANREQFQRAGAEREILKVHKREKFLVSDFEFFTIL